MKMSGTTAEYGQDADDTDGQSLVEMGYSFDDDGVLRDINGERFRFMNQAHYEQLGKAITHEIYRRMRCEPYKMIKAYLPDSRAFIYHSADYATCNNLVVLIHGSGVVRAGQWARRLIINDGLEKGSQFPYIRKCQQYDWGVLAMNTNMNTYLSDGDRLSIEGSTTPAEHGINVWEAFVKPCEAENIAIVAHSAGGMVVSQIMGDEKCWDEKTAQRVRCICLTDAIFEPHRFANSKLRTHIRNWLTAEDDEPGRVINNDEFMCCVASGTKVHEETSSKAIEDIFKFIIRHFE